MLLQVYINKLTENYGVKIFCSQQMFVNRFQKVVGFWSNVPLKEQLLLFFVRGLFTNGVTKIIRSYLVSLPLIIFGDRVTSFQSPFPLEPSKITKEWSPPVKANRKADMFLHLQIFLFKEVWFQLHPTIIPQFSLFVKLWARHPGVMETKATKDDVKKLALKAMPSSKRIRNTSNCSSKCNDIFVQMDIK